MRTAGSNRLRGELAGNELRTRKEYVSDHDGGFKQPLERCKLLTRWAFEYFDQTGTASMHGRSIPIPAMMSTPVWKPWGARMNSRPCSASRPPQPRRRYM